VAGGRGRRGRITDFPKTPLHRSYRLFAAVTDWSENRSGVIVSRDRGTTWSWSLQTREWPTALAAAPQGLFAAGPTNVAPYVVRFDWREGSYGHPSRRT
jgi:hypothetical protein